MLGHFAATLLVQVYSNVRNFKNDLRKYQPHFLIVVPRLLETIWKVIHPGHRSRKTRARRIDGSTRKPHCVSFVHLMLARPPVEIHTSDVSGTHFAASVMLPERLTGTATALSFKLSSACTTWEDDPAYPGAGTIGPACCLYDYISNHNTMVAAFSFWDDATRSICTRLSVPQAHAARPYA